MEKEKRTQNKEDKIMFEYLKNYYKKNAFVIAASMAALSGDFRSLL